MKRSEINKALKDMHDLILRLRLFSLANYY